MGLVMYAASKHAVTALTEGLRRELVKHNSNIRVNVSVNQYGYFVLSSTLEITK
jgi:NAD(P)-dependent dehydrogenase (short-subunit alcohol dehydrogenase family)